MQPVIFFDGICNLCNKTVQIVIDNDSRGVFKFASLQSDFAQKKLPIFEIDPLQNNSFILLDNGMVYQQSTAALKVARKLGGFWPLLYAFIIVPKFIRDGVYRFIAKNRYKWFGNSESCWLPTPALKEKFYN